MSNEAVILEDVALLHQAMYDKMSTIVGIEGLHFLGFDSGKDRNPLVQVALHISMDELIVDRLRPGPAEAHRIEEDEGEEVIESYSGEVFTGYDERKLVYPLPVSIIYHISSWCHSSQTELALIQAVLQKFPDRGIVTLQIEGEDFAFPIELLGIEVLDDLSQNIRERLFRFKIEAWVKSHIQDGMRRIIKESEIHVYDGETIEDINMPGKNIPMTSAVIIPDE